MIPVARKGWFVKRSPRPAALQRRFTIASGSLQGTVYYQSYGTALIVNYSQDGLAAPYGAATLAIRPGEAEPRLVAGADACRVCHSVSSQGQRLVTQGGARSDSYSYDLLNGNGETPYQQPDGSYVTKRVDFWPRTHPAGFTLEVR